MSVGTVFSMGISMGNTNLRRKQIKFTIYEEKRIHVLKLGRYNVTFTRTMRFLRFTFETRTHLRFTEGVSFTNLLGK